MSGVTHHVNPQGLFIVRGMWQDGGLTEGERHGDTINRAGGVRAAH
jgi:S-adenosylmethionine synthetase